MPQIDTSVLDGAMSSSFYSVNRALRGLQPFRHSCGIALDWLGWTHEEAVARAMAECFYDLHTAGALGQRSGETAYRGIWLTQAQANQIHHERIFHDAGYSFAATSSGEALFHVDDKAAQHKNIDDDHIPIIMRIVPGRASLYIPGPEEDDPFSIRSQGVLTNNLIDGQYILDRHSVLKAYEFASLKPDGQRRVGLIDCRQIQ